MSTTPSSSIQSMNSHNNTKSAEQYNELGKQCYIQQQLLNDALHYFTTGIEYALNNNNNNHIDQHSLYNSDTINILSVLYCNRSLVYIDLQQYDNALNDAQRSLSHDTTWYKPYIRIAQCYECLEQYNGALEHYQKAYNRNNDTRNNVYINNKIAQCKLHIQYLPKKSEIEQQQHDNNSTQQQPIIISHIEYNPQYAVSCRQLYQLIDWLQQNQHTQLSTLYIHLYSSLSRSVYTYDNIKESTTVLNIPCQYILTTDMAKSSNIGQKIQNSKITLLSTHSYLACYLLTEIYDSQHSSIWKYYIDCLPIYYDTIPLFFTDEFINTWLTGSFTVNKIEDRRGELYDEWSQLTQHIHTLKQYRYSDFVICRLYVITRIFGMCINDKKTDGLVPLADMLNHKRPRETSWEYNQQYNSFTIQTLTDIKQYNEIYDSYGRKCQSRFFVNYGFTTDLYQNFIDNSCIIHIVFKSNNIDNYSIKCNLLGYSSINEYSIEYNKNHQLYSDFNEKQTIEIFSLCRIFYANTQELMNLQSMYNFNAKQIQPISIQNEYKTLKFIQQCCSQTLSQFNTSLEHDMTLYNNHINNIHTLTINEYNSLVQRISEKQVLQYYIDIYNIVHDIITSNISYKRLKNNIRDLVQQLNNNGKKQVEQYLEDTIYTLLRDVQR